MLLSLLFTLNFSFAADGILLIGDSHTTGCFGRTLDTALRIQTPLTRTSATCGSSTLSWLKANGHSTSCGYLSCIPRGNCKFTNNGTSRSLSSLLSTDRPQWTLVALGSNMLKADWNRTMTDVGRVIDLIQQAGSRCTWIGPPQASTRYISIRDYEAFVKLMKDTVVARGCTFIDSGLITDRRKLSDQLHYPCSEATQWANRVIGQF